MFLMMLKKDTTQFMSIFKRMPTDDGDGTVIRAGGYHFTLLEN